MERWSPVIHCAGNVVAQDAVATFGTVCAMTAPASAKNLRHVVFSFQTSFPFFFEKYNSVDILGFRCYSARRIK